MKFAWNSKCQEAFDFLRKELSNTPVLAHPDFSTRFILDTDASNFSIGAVLSQVQDGIERPIAFASRSLTKSEKKYCVTRKELLAAVHFVKYFRHYLYGRQFTLRTDHSSLRWLMNFKDPEGQLARWMDVLSTYDFTIEHRPGNLHGNADSLSRAPKHCKQCHADHVNICIAKMEDEVVLSKPLRCLQDEDKDITTVKELLVHNTKCTKDVAAQSLTVKSLCSQLDRLVIKDNVLYRRSTDLVSG